MKIRLSLSLVSLGLLASLSGCAAMLPIAGALVLKEAADRYEAANKPQDPAAAPADTTVAAVPDDAAPQVETEQAAVKTKIASAKPAKNQAKPAVRVAARPAPVAAAEPEPSEIEADDSESEETVSDDEPVQEEVVAAPVRKPAVKSQPSSRVQTKPVVNTAAKLQTKGTPGFVASKTNTTPGMPDATARGKDKAQAAIKTAASVPTTEAQANESATDSSARILATALKRIPNPQATPATKPAPIIPQKTN